MPHSKALRCRNADKWQSRACFPVRRSAGRCFADRCFAARLSADRYFADRCFASVACRQGRKLSGKHPRSGAGQHDKWPRSGYANPAIAIFPPRLFLRHYSAALFFCEASFITLLTTTLHHYLAAAAIFTVTSWPWLLPGIRRFLLRLVLRVRARRRVRGGASCRGRFFRGCRFRRCFRANRWGSNLL